MRLATVIGYTKIANATKCCHLSVPGTSIFSGRTVSVPTQMAIVNTTVRNMALLMSGNIKNFKYFDIGYVSNQLKSHIITRANLNDIKSGGLMKPKLSTKTSYSIEYFTF